MYYYNDDKFETQAKTLGEGVRSQFVSYKNTIYILLYHFLIGAVLNSRICFSVKKESSVI